MAANQGNNRRDMLIGEDTKVQKRGISHGGKQEQPRRADLELTSAQKEAEAMQAGARRKKGRVVQSRRPARCRWLPSRAAPSEEGEILRSPNPTPPPGNGKGREESAAGRGGEANRPQRAPQAAKAVCSAGGAWESMGCVGPPLLCTCHPLGSEALLPSRVHSN